MANISWIPSDFAAFQSYNCTIAAEWSARYWHSMDPPLYWTIHFLQDAFQHSPASGNTSSYDSYSVMSWVLGLSKDQEEDLWDHMDDYAFKACKHEVCPRIGWRGNSDLAGRGMLVNYILQAALATLYFVILISHRLDRIPTTLKKQRIWMKIQNAIEHSTRVFLDAAVLFCLSMLMAAMVTLAKSVHNPMVPLPSYTKITSAFMAFYSMLPAVVLHASISHKLRRARWRRALWMFTAGLEIVVFVLYLRSPDMLARYQPPSIYNDYQTPEATKKFIKSLQEPDQFAWDAYCMNHKAGRNFTTYLWCFNALIAFLAAAYGALIAAAFYHLHVARRPWVLTLRKWWWLIAAFLSLVGMWSCLAIFMHYRKKLSEGGTGSNQDFEWSFGQILGLATWVPVIIELIHILVQGPKEALTGQVVAPFYVTADDGMDDQKLKLDDGLELLGYKEVPE